MGMAASQARYLGLAARKTNCEYQGQQINQARTALGNQSAELWNQMLGLSVPTVPNCSKIKKFFGSAPKDIQDAVLIPIVTIFFAFFFLGEKITLQGGISSAVTIAALFVSEIRFSK